MELKQIYDKLPFIHCKGHCHKTCGPIAMGEAELALIKEKYNIDLSPSMLLERIKEGKVDCQALTADKRCSIYDDRPLVCRLYGLVKQLKCQWGCKPKRYLAHRKAVEYIKIVDEM